MRSFFERISKDKNIFSYLLKDGVYEPFETQLIRSMLKKGDTVIDIGANIGYYTLLMAETVGSEGCVYAFEPEPNNYGLLTKNIKANNYSNIIPVQKALSDKDGSIKVYCDERNFSGATFAKENLAIKSNNFTEVLTTSLDKCFVDSKIRLIKIDTQGAEGLIMAGAQSLLKNKNLIIFTEFWPYGLRNMGTDPKELLRTLREYGYTIKLIDEKNKTLRDINNEEIFAICASEKEGKHHINLLLQS